MRTAAAYDDARAALEYWTDEVGDSSPLYRFLAERVAADDTAVALLAEAPDEQRRGNLLFAAVHHLLLTLDDVISPTNVPSQEIGGTKPAGTSVWMSRDGAAPSGLVPEELLPGLR